MHLLLFFLYNYDPLLLSFFFLKKFFLTFSSLSENYPKDYSQLLWGFAEKQAIKGSKDALW